MSGSLIRSALLALEKSGEFEPSHELAGQLRDLNIGKWSGSKVRLGIKGRADLWAYLEREYGILPGTKAGDWIGLTRSEATALGTNEKLARRAVRASRVAVKTFAGGTLLYGRCRGDGGDGDGVDGGGDRSGHGEGSDAFVLPPRISFDAAIKDAPLFRNFAIVLVENWETFERIDLLSFPVPPGLEQAMLVFRGDVASYPTAAAKAFLEASAKPVYVLGDPDPAGLVIALRTPHFAGLVAPPLADLEACLKAGRGDTERYRSQLQGSAQLLDACTHPQVRAYWDLIQHYGRAIPQEEFTRHLP